MDKDKKKTKTTKTADVEDKKEDKKEKKTRGKSKDKKASKEDKKEKKEKKPRKKNTDKSGIKRPPNAYLLFCNEKREEVKKENPDLKGKDFMKKLGELWKAQEDKSKWQNMAAKEKEKYEKTIADINAQTSIIQKEDRTLELRLKQLETEQNAVKTEIDAVKKIIKDNVEKTFKTFSD